MNEELKYELSLIEGRIKRTLTTKVNHDRYCEVGNLSAKEKDLLRSLLERRKHVLNKLFLCSPAEIARLKEVNGRLYYLTQKLHEKTYSLYKALLQSGHDPDFDDDIMIEGTLTYLVDGWDDSDSVLKMVEDEEYDSDFAFMMGLISDLNRDKYTYPCARTFLSFDPTHTPDMTMEQLHLNNSLDDGVSWDHPGRFKDICVCHAIYSLTSDNLFSYPDVLRMNDFWCEVKVTHQLLSDLKGNRSSCIENRLNK